MRGGLPRAREAVTASGGLGESPGESLTRLVHASVDAEVRPQVEIHDRDGVLGVGTRLSSRLRGWGVSPGS